MNKPKVMIFDVFYAYNKDVDRLSEKELSVNVIIAK